MWLAGLLILGAAVLVLLFFGWTRAAWVVPGASVLGIWVVGSGATVPWMIVASVFAAAVLFLAFAPFRRLIVTPPVMRAVGKILPQMSQSEKEALEAGTVWWDGDLFSGSPEWSKLLDAPKAQLSAEEQAFLDGPVNQVCAMVSDWEVTQNGDLPTEVWDYLKAEGFFGMIIRKQYGGREFSAQAHSQVVARLAGRSTGLAVTVMVPNSLGPAELLQHYGTEEQKDYYLPRLASGEDVPCFALTEPGAGSDAGSLTSSGIVENGTYDGKEMLGIRLNWSKRYITLSPVATLLGLAFRLYDPDHLMGDNEDLGITCALIPTHLKGVRTGDRHDPLGCAFLNGPTFGENVFVPLDFIIGGQDNAGKGWTMLMQCLSVGRGISLPSLSAGGMQLCTRTTGAYATVREQFNMPVGRFEGVQEVLGRIAGTTYAFEAVRSVTAACVDAGEKPSVASAIAKCYATEAMRQVCNDAMDVVGGSGISCGPKNILASAYMGSPIGITVEGANILTRTMIIFGQGALRCHPFAQHEIQAVADKDRSAFDRAFFGHVGFVFQNAARSFLLGITGSKLSGSPVMGPMEKYYQRLNRLSACFALSADTAMGTLGGLLKRKETITGQLADALSWMYVASCTLKRFYDEGQKDADLPYASWACEHALHQSQAGLVAFLENLPNRSAAWLLRRVQFPFGARLRTPSDRLTLKGARGILEDGEARLNLSPMTYSPQPDEPGLGELESALAKIMAIRPIEDRIKEATRTQQLARKPVATIVQRAKEAGVINGEEVEAIASAERARERVVAVDSFGGDDFVRRNAVTEDLLAR